MRLILLALLLQFAALTCFSQTNCAIPVLTVTAKDKWLSPKTPNKLPAEISLQLSAAKDCEPLGNYSIVSGKIYLVSGSFPKKIKDFTGATISLKDWQKLYKPGERLVIEITALNLTDAAGTTQTITEGPAISLPLK